MILLWANSATGTAGKDFEVDSSLARDREIRLTTASLPHDVRSRAGCSGWKARHRTSLAVQQQRFATNDSNADYLNP